MTDGQMHKEPSTWNLAVVAYGVPTLTNVRITQ